MEKNRTYKEYNTSELFRMPWTMADNSNTWLDITRDCDITCEYCVQDHDSATNKCLETLEFEIKELIRLRKCDSMLIGGGEPLIHPQIKSIIKLVKAQKVKPFIISNGNALTKELLKELKEAGLWGFILHIDSGQNRPGWLNKNEKELNELRQHLADMIYEEKGIVCSFITTIVPRALREVPDIIRWTSENIDKAVQNILVPVQGLYTTDPFDHYVNGEKINIESTALCQEENYKKMSSLDLYKELLKVLPEYNFNSFLGGTHRAEAPKWLFGLYIRSKKKYLGNIGPKGMELIQSMHHLFRGRFISFLKPKYYKNAWILFTLIFFDRGIRKTFGRYLFSILKNPLQIFRRIYFQSIILLQPFDLLENGDTDMCDGCPNKTYWNGRLISECRMEEFLNYGKQISFVANKEARSKNKRKKKITQPCC